MPARILATGRAVPATAARILPLMHPIAVGSGVEIAPGTVDRQTFTVYLGAQGGEVYYIFGNDLKALPLGEFTHNFWIGEAAAEIYRRTKWIIPAARIVTAFAMGAASGFIGAAGAGAAIFVAGVNVAISMARFAAFLNAHPHETEIVRRNLGPAVEALLWFRDNCPVLYGKLSGLMGRAAREALMSAPSGITAEDVANLLGRFLGGATGGADAGLNVLVRMIARTTVIYSAIHLPGAAAHGVAARRDDFANAMIAALREQHASLTPAEEAAIRTELGRSAEAIRRTEQFNTAMTALQPALERLARDLAAM